jgi:SOS-response transcriptional repressor LexA
MVMDSTSSQGLPSREDQLDPIRKLVLERTREAGLDLATLSRHVLKNATYMHQYIWRGSPKSLPEDVREALAERLGIPESQLRSVQQTRQPRVTALPRPVGVLITGRQTASSTQTAGKVPVFSDEGPINLTEAADWTERPPLLQSAASAFAVWIGRDRGRRLAQGDLAFVHGLQTARVGDAVAVMRGPDLMTIGDLIATEDGYVRVAAGAGKPDRIKTEPGDRFLKIVSVQFG